MTSIPDAAHDCHHPDASETSHARRWLLAIILLVVVVTAATHWPAVRNDLVMWDDDVYTRTAEVQAARGWAAIPWAFSQFVPFYYHPITWLSHVSDVWVFGRRWVGPHAENVVIHALNAGLVVGLLWWLPLPSPGNLHKLLAATMVGLIFGLHPLQVESVAWIAERKNLLCGLFSLGCITAYVGYARSEARKRWWYGLVSLLFVLALLSKPMAVALPATMLILDCYPLARWQSAGWRRVLGEKIPFFVLTAGLAVATIYGQSVWGALKPMQHLGVLERVLVATRGFVFYLKKLIWPVRLSPYYPLGDDVAVLQAEFLVPLAILVVITGVVLRQRKRVPGVLAAWGVYLVWLIPVSGLVQAGAQAAANRFMYLALLPPVIVVVRGGNWLWCRWNLIGRAVLVVLTCTILVFLSARTGSEIKLWRDEESLWRAVTKFFPDSGVANFHLAMALVDQWRFAEALPHARYAVTILDDNPLAHATLGLIYLKTEAYESAIPELRRALQQEPEFWASRYNLACALSQLHRFAEAWEILPEVLRRQPQYAGMAVRDRELTALRENPEYGPRLHALTAEVTTTDH